MNRLPRIEKIIAVRPFQVDCLWTTGEVLTADVSSTLKAKPEKFGSLLQPDYFVQVSLFDADGDKTGTLNWPNGLDFCPDVLYEMSLNNQSKLLQ